MNYNFKQKTFSGEIVDAEIINIPDNAIFYKVNENNWYVIIPDCKEKNLHFRGKNCFAVHTYIIFGYVFISLKNIIAERWEDNGKLLNDFFKDKYILRYKKSDPHKLIEAFRIKGLALNDSVFTTRVFVNDVFSVIDTFNMKMFYIEDMTLDIYDSEYSYVLSKNGEIYNEMFENAINFLK